MRCRWSVWTDIRDTIDAFKKTMPLIIDLRNPAMRPRHWQQLMDHIGSRFDPNSDTFTLAKVTLLLDFVGRLKLAGPKVVT
jgi:dynein heavy chain